MKKKSYQKPVLVKSGTLSRSTAVLDNGANFSLISD